MLAQKFPKKNSACKPVATAPSHEPECFRMNCCSAKKSDQVKFKLVATFFDSGFPPKEIASTTMNIASLKNMSGSSNYLRLTNADGTSGPKADNFSMKVKFKISFIKKRQFTSK